MLREGTGVMGHLTRNTAPGSSSAPSLPQESLWRWHLEPEIFFKTQFPWSQLPPCSNDRAPCSLSKLQGLCSSVHWWASIVLKCWSHSVPPEDVSPPHSLINLGHVTETDRRTLAPGPHGSQPHAISLTWPRKLWTFSFFNIYFIYYLFGRVRA